MSELVTRACYPEFLMASVIKNVIPRLFGTVKWSREIYLSIMRIVHHPTILRTRRVYNPIICKSKSIIYSAQQPGDKPFSEEYFVC